MRALAIEINDAGITIADETGVLGTELGYAFVDRGRIQTGAEAARQARVRPRQVTNRYWSALSMEPGSGGLDGGGSAAELAFAQLNSIWQRFGNGVTDVLLVVPGNYRSEQLGLLLGLAQECDIPVRALVDAAAAASVRPYSNRQLLYADASLHRVSATTLEQGAEATALGEQELATTGLANVRDAFARRFAEMFVLMTRHDPFHHADAEQQLYDHLPEWLGALHERDSIECVLQRRDEEFRVTVERDAVLVVAAGFYRAVLQTIGRMREADGSLVVQLSARLAELPGLVAALARLDDAEIVRLPAGHAAQSALAAQHLLAASPDGVKLVKHLPWRSAAAADAGAAAAPRPASEPARESPTHVVYRGVVYRVDAKGLVIGREAVNGRRTIVVDDQASVSREHCELVLRDGELKLRDLSRYGTYVNEKRISGETMLRRADVIRIGSPGAELQIVGMEVANAAS
jgi:FHA domain-containing protein